VVKATARAPSEASLLNDPDSEWLYMSNVLGWLLKSGGAAPSFDGNMIPIAKGALDDTGDSLGDVQRADIAGEPPTTDTRNNGWYGVKQNVMDLTGFGITKSGAINSVTLKVVFVNRKESHLITEKRAS
jgi:hypothetical protein